ncbi:MAG: SAM-dependent methyltransferase [Clostridia bacterium]|nr:SAM-dependent methyltransferase [Clostridia bacterium]MBR2371229.1 SAM-dependent methyltransferase [Clostridia bacterium]
MNLPKLDQRLMCAAEAVPQCDVVADVGTDHAYLPVYLVLRGKCNYAIASDINEGPVKRAVLNVTGYGLNSKVQVIKTDGLHGIEEYKPDTVLILGMGGELIAKILAEAPWLKSNKTRLILQPMTHPEVVREYLWTSGFGILEEKLCQCGKIYNVIVAEYIGQSTEYTPIEALVGKTDMLCGCDLWTPYLQHIAEIYSVRIKGILSGGGDASCEEKTLSEIQSLI